MVEYIFSKPGVAKVYALEASLKTTPSYSYFSYTDPELLIGTTQPLTDTQYTQLETLINNYTDPAVFLVLNSTVPDTIRSSPTNSQSPEIVQSFIFTNTNMYGSGTFNSIKTVLEYSTQDVTQWANFSGNLTVQFQLHDYTRDKSICMNTINVTDIANSWKQMATSGATGPRKVFRSFQVDGLRNNSPNYDCLWNYILSVSDPKLTVTIQSKQMLYYDIM